MYDLIVLGGGPGGYMAAERAGAAGLKVMLVEKEHLGGVCLNEGCIPTKTLLNSAKIYRHACETVDAYGISCENPQIYHEKVIERKEKVVATLVNGVKYQMTANNVEVITGEGSIVGKGSEVRDAWQPGLCFIIHIRLCRIIYCRPKTGRNQLLP